MAKTISLTDPKAIETILTAQGCPTKTRKQKQQRLADVEVNLQELRDAFEEEECADKRANMADTIDELETEKTDLEQWLDATAP